MILYEVEPEPVLAVFVYNKALLLCELQRSFIDKSLNYRRNFES